jgi:diaminohydroxyphosphoribosylaminopyrimidine deaminase/5-amino-6-(5-phosphoribosylamino)uracil reductase
MPDVSLVQQVLQALYQLKIVSVLIEGGAQLLQSFIEEGVWDEARVIVNEDLVIDKGLSAPELSHHKPVDRKQLQQDRIHYYVPVDR